MGYDNNRQRESLSALMDNQADEVELRRVLKSVSTDDELRATWHRYQLASAAMRRELPPRMVDLSSRISEAVSDEPRPKPGLSRFLQPLGRVAVAASVAVVAVLGVQQMQPMAPATGEQQPETAGVSAPERPDSPQFQLPAGYDFPPVTGRTVSAGSQPAQSSRQPVVVVKQEHLRPDVPNQAEVENYLNLIMQQHTRQAAGNSGQGMMPYARLPQEAADAP